MEEVTLDSMEYVVLEDEYKKDRQERYILVAKGMRNVSTEYVTYLKNDRGVTQGHYFADLASALQDFKKRINN